MLLVLIGNTSNVSYIGKITSSGGQIVTKGGGCHITEYLCFQLHVYFCILHCTNCHYFDLYAKINNWPFIVLVLFFSNYIPHNLCIYNIIFIWTSTRGTRDNKEVEHNFYTNTIINSSSARGSGHDVNECPVFGKRTNSLNIKKTQMF